MTTTIAVLIATSKTSSADFATFTTAAPTATRTNGNTNHFDENNKNHDNN